MLLSHFSPVRLFAALWTVAFQAPLSMESFGQRYSSRLPFPFPEDLSNPGIESRAPAASPELQVDPLPLVLPGKPQDMFIYI